MVNNVVLVGRITRDVELRKTQSGTSVVSFTLAVNRKFNKEEQQADFINVVAWTHSADFMAKYVEKGNLLAIEGRIQTRNYEDKTGQRVYVTEVVANSVQLLEWKERETSYQNETTNETVEEYEETTLDISADDLPF